MNVRSTVIFDIFSRLSRWCLLNCAMVIALSGSSTESIAQAPAAANPNEARAALAAGDYDRAIELFREVIKVNPQDFDSLTQMAAAYYHSGLPRRAMRYLKHAEKRTTLKSYNLLYQGLSYGALGAREKARLYLKNAAQFPDQFGARSMFELGVMDYRADSMERASHWLNLYVQRHPAGAYRAEAIKLLNGIRDGKRLPQAQSTDQSDMESALYKYNSLSLGTMPHFWFAEIGGKGNWLSSFDKDDKGVFSPQETATQAIIANAGIGIGPIRSAKGTVWAGYSYLQDWTSSPDRLETYMEDWTDIEYQPFRTDLLQRRHQFYADFRQEFPFHIFAGAYARIEFARIGSSLFSGPEIQSFDSEVQPISDTTWFIPWIGYSWSPTSRTFGYYYFRKEINSESPEFSNKSYSFDVGASGSPPVSLGLTHDMEFPQFKSEISAEIYSYEFIANDYWLDYSRQGVNFGVDHEVVPRIFLDLNGGYYRDAYIENILKNISCSATTFAEGAALLQNDGSGPLDSSPRECQRTEDGFSAKAGIYWNYSQFHRFSFDFRYTANNNEEQKEFRTTDMAMIGTATIAFPSVKRVARFVSRFADSTFAKKGQ